MIPFEILRGKRVDLDKHEMKDGTVYFCIDDGTMHIDCLNDEGILTRIQINANNANTLNNKTLEEIKEEALSSVPFAEVYSV